MKTKAIIITLIFTFFLSGIAAQTEKGRFLIGANSSLTFASVKGEALGINTEKIKTVKVMPSASYFVFDNLSAGLAMEYDYQSTNNGASVSVLTDFRYYLTKSVVRPYIKANIGYINTNKEILGHQYEYDASLHGMRVGGGLGLAFFLSNSISLDLTGYYYLNKLNDLGDGYFDKTNNTSYKVKTTTQALNVYVGLSWYI